MKYIINGPKTLFGKISTPRAKNSYLAILSASLLCSGIVILRECPDFVDINYMLEILKTLGCKIEKCAGKLTIDARNITNFSVPKELASKIRSSIFLLGSILGRLHEAKVSYPGGCDIGSRPIDLHLKGIRALNVEIKERFGYIECKTDCIIGNNIHLDYPSVGATENIILLASLSKGTTRIYNCAKEPEIIDLQNFINKMGGKVYGAGSSTIVIEGVDKLYSVDFTPMTDRIIAGTYLLGAATCGGDVLVENVEYEHIYSLITKLKEAGFDIDIKNDSIRLKSSSRKNSFNKIETLPYPGFPTDLQPQSLVLQTVSAGSCIITENLFETRLKHVPELIKMGANITTKDRVAFVTGVENLYGAEVTSTDLRAGAALTIAGIKAQGQTVLNNTEIIDRGYERLDLAFNSLGADITKVE